MPASKHLKAPGAHLLAPDPIPGGIPGLGAGDTGQLAGVNTPPAASPEALAAGANALAQPGVPQLGVAV